MIKGLREDKAFLAHDRSIRSRIVEHLKTCEGLTLQMMGTMGDMRQSPALKDVDLIRRTILKLKPSLEFAGTSVKLLRKEQPLNEEAIAHMLLTSELMLLESRNAVQTLQEATLSSDLNAADSRALLRNVNVSLQNLEKMRLLHNDLGEGSLAGSRAFEKIAESYDLRDLGRLETLSGEEGIDNWETRIYGEIKVQNTSILRKFLAFITRKTPYEKEIGELILQLGQRSKNQSGGLITLSDLYVTIQKARPLLSLSLEDIEKTVESLSRKGVIPGIHMYSNVKVVELLPLTFTSDQNTILEIAAKKGEVTLEEVITNTKWTADRAQRALNEMERFGISRFDLASNKWIFPAFSGLGGKNP